MSYQPTKTTFRPPLEQQKTFTTNHKEDGTDSNQWERGGEGWTVLTGKWWDEEVS